MTHLNIALLGAFQVTLDDTEITGFRTDKMRALLAYLCTEAARPHRRETLMDLLWPGQPGETATVNLRQALYKLRQLLGESGEQSPAGTSFLLVSPLTVQFNASSDHRLDVTAFSDLVAATRSHRHRNAAWCTICHGRLEQAAQLYRGNLMEGFALADSQPFDEWLLLKREGLRRAAWEVFGLLAGYHQMRGDYPLALEYTYRQLELEPWDEEIHRQAMWLLAAMGRRSAALAQYQACKQALARELDVPPTEETTALFDIIRTGLPVPPLDAPFTARRRHNLPAQVTPFIGRDQDLARLAERLENPDYRLVTLIGPGGVGKTRLALRAAEAQVGAFADGVYWVPLAAVLPAPQLAQVLATAIAQAVGLPLQGHDEPRAQLLGYLRDKEVLLVLDNFEHLLGSRADEAGAAADLLAAILQQAPRVSLLVTSRERLGLHAESLLDLAGLADPSAVQLFVERAQQIDPGFALDSGTTDGVAQICRLVAGLPLGIVLAAAWVRHFSPARIAAAIQANLDFLAGAARDAAPQHGSLRAVFDHSWGLLMTDEQDLFRRLAVFRGGWDEEAARQVAGAEVRALVSLTDKSLLRQDRAGRFDIHEVLRQYAAEKLDEVPAERDQVARRHAEYYLELAEQGEAALRGGEQASWLERLEREHDNLRAVLQWARAGDELAEPRRGGEAPGFAGDTAIALRMGGALWRFWYVRGYVSEGRTQLVAALQIATPEDTALLAARAKVLHGAGSLASQQGDHQASRAFYSQSLALRRELGDKQGIATSLNNLGLLAHEEGEYDTARALHEESLALRRELQDSAGQGSSLNNLGILAYHRGDYEAANALYNESLTLRRELGDQRSIALLLSNLGIVAQSRGDYEAARAWHEESLAMMRELGDQHGIATALTSLGIVAQNQEHFALAQTLHDESLALNRALGDKSRIALSLYNLGVVAQAGRDYARAHKLYHESLNIRKDLGDTLGIAATLNVLGLLAQAQADYDTARALHQESLALYGDLGALRNVAACLACLGGVAVGRATQQDLSSHTPNDPDPAGLLVEAARLFGVVAGLLERMGSVLDIEDRQPYERNVAIVRAALGAEAFAAAHAAGLALPLEQAIGEALAPLTRTED